MGTTERDADGAGEQPEGRDGVDGAGGAPHGPTDDTGRDLPDETPPGPDGWPVVGTSLSFVRDPWSFYDRLATYGDVVSWRMYRFDMVSALHPDHVERVLVTDADAYEKTLFGDVGIDFAADGLVFASGEQWRAQRTLLQEAFTLDRIRRYGESMVDVAADRVADWEDGQALALDAAYSDLTLAILARTLFDVDLGERGEVVTRVANALNARADVRNVQNFLPSWIPTRTRRRWERATADFDRMVEDLLAEREGASDLADRDDLLSILLAAEGPDGYEHSEAELRDQLLTFLFAGHDTTSLALTYTCLLLAQHDDVLARLREEWDAVLGDGPARPSAVADLEYTDRVLSEALRLYPPVPVVLREAARDVELGGYRIPAGTKLSLPQFHLHADERFYDDPETFHPDRWTDSFEDELPDYAYFPFGGGPRHCIGMRFARMELQLVLPTVLRAVDLELLSDPDPEIVPGATSKPAEPVRVRVRRRD